LWRCSLEMCFSTHMTMVVSFNCMFFKCLRRTITKKMMIMHPISIWSPSRICCNLPFANITLRQLIVSTNRKCFHFDQRSH
jgi:hypothetical protein